jgi:hypothetical protein
MHFQRQFLVIFLTLLIFASSLYAAPKTHVGVPPGELVLLTATCFSSANSCAPFKRRFADGTSEENGFLVPPGKMLVLTELDWDYLNSGESAAGLDKERVLLQLSVENLADEDIGGPILRSASIAQYKNCVDPCQPHAFAFKNVSLTSGFALSSGGFLRYVLSVPLIVSGPGSSLTVLIADI